VGVHGGYLSAGFSSEKQGLSSRTAAHIQDSGACGQPTDRGQGLPGSRLRAGTLLGKSLVDLEKHVQGWFVFRHIITYYHEGSLDERISARVGRCSDGSGAPQFPRESSF